jgi:carbon-monoxide dehydrogenase iron sulfur subunit
MKRLIVDASVCAGCRVCELYCAYSHYKKFSPSLSRITVIKIDKHGLDYPLTCRQCSFCSAMEACPIDALTRADDGTIHVNIETCIGCGRCAESCAYSTVKMWDSKPIICDLCGGDPECVKRCPTNALRYEEADFFSERPEEAFSKLRKEWGIDA